ncbi:MAG: trypsin-like peptidase domain-containing protein [Oscillospiraceae bacterium]|nr:trypsin-like peptidase domain-containing protein [Oscillospiraceae bacterium]
MEQQTGNPWYDQSLPTGEAAPPPQAKKRRKPDVPLILFILFTLVFVALYTLTNGFTAWFPAPRTSETGFSVVPDWPALQKPEQEDYDDYRSYYRALYGDKEDSRSGSRLERVKPETAPEFTLQSGKGQRELSLQELYSRCAQSVVGIRADYADESGYAWGTGIVVSADGLILTNQHVIDLATSATVTLSDGGEYPAKLVGEDVITDIALLKIQAEGLVPAQFGDSGELQVGESVAAIGNPLSDRFTNSLTDGIVSAINRDVTVDGRQMTLIQTNAALNEGNSGGPLLNRRGQVVGVTNMKMVNYYSEVTVEGIGFAIPSTTVKTVVDQLLAQGSVVGRPGIGITVIPVDRTVSERFDIPRGLYVCDVERSSDAWAQGVRPDDIILKVNGLEVRSSSELIAIRDSLSVGDSLDVTLWRDGQQLRLSFRLMDQNELT